MTRLQMLRSPLNIRPGEGRLVGLMLVFAIFMGIPSLITETTAYSLFLVEFNAQAIPYVYIGFTIVATLSGFIYTKLEKRISFARFATINLVILTLVLVFFRFLLQFNSSKWPIAALTIWYETSWALANLGFWSVTVYLFNVRQGKRLFSLIGVGFTLSESTVGFFVPAMVKLMGTANLLLVAAASFGIALIVQTYILRTFPHPISASDDETEDEEQVAKKTSPFSDLLKNQYILLIFTMAALYAMLFYALDIVFYDRVETQYLNADQLASFLGVFFAISGTATLVLGTFVAGPYISRYGVGTGLLTMPVVIIIGSASIILVGTMFNTLALLFWLVVITKLFNDMLAYTVNRTSWQVLYEPLPTKQRLRAQTIVESMVKPVAGGLAGVILILFNSVFGFGAVQIAYVLVIILAIWIGVVIRLNRVYLKVLQQALTRRKFGKNTALEVDETSVDILKRGLTSENVSVVIYSLNMLEEIEPNSLPIFLQEMLGHSTPGIRLVALKRIERFELTDVVPAIKFRLKYENSPSVHGYALRTLAILDGAEMFDEVYKQTNNPNPKIRCGAIAGLLRSQKLTPYQATIVHRKVEILLNSPDPNDRRLLAEVLGEVNIPALSGPLLNLLKDSNLQVRKEAVIAAGKLKYSDFWPAVIENLALPTVRAASAQSLVAGGEAAFPDIKAAFVTMRRNRVVLNRLIRVCGRIKGQPSIALLKDRLSYPDVQIRTQILMALSQCNYKADEQETIMLLQRVKTEIGQAAWTLAARNDIGNDKEVAQLQDALNKVFIQQRNRTLLLLSFIYDTESILQIQEVFDETRNNQNSIISNKKQGYALELIETLLPQRLKCLLIPLLDDLTPDERLQQLRQKFPQQELGRIRRLQDIITRPEAWLDPWTKACALYSVGQLSAKHLSEPVIFALTAPDYIVKDTAARTLLKLSPQLYAAHINGTAKLINDGLILTTNKLHMGDTHMLSLIERVIFLKSVGFFCEAPEHVLTELAYILEESEAKSGEVIIKKGEAGSSLYIVVDGQVQVHDNNYIIVTLESKEVFGELSLLDPGPRSASVTATEKTRLLRLDQEPFYELIDDHSVVARRIMQNLVKNLRQAHSKAQMQQNNDNGNIPQKRIINFYPNS